MENRTNPAARAFAAVALVGAAIVVIAIVAGSLGGDSDSSSTTGRHGTHRTGSKSGGHTIEASSYVIQTGDTLVAIAHRTGVPVARIIELNPEVDPQILTAGEKLKLR